MSEAIGIYNSIIGQDLDVGHGPGMKRMKAVAGAIPELAPFMEDLMDFSTIAMKEVRAAEALGLSSPVRDVEPAAEKTNVNAYRQMVDDMSNVDKLLASGRSGSFTDRV